MSRCSGKAFDIDAYLDRTVEVMLGDANDEGRWCYDGEKFIDGVFRVPTRCPRCNNTEVTLVAFAPARSRTTDASARPTTPKASALLGDPGYHVIAVACDDCDWAEVAEGCPICTAASPLRARP